MPEWAVLTLRIALAVAGDNSIDADQQFVGRWARAAEAVTDTVRQRLRNRPQCSILTLSGLLRCSSKEAGSCESRRRPGLRDRPKRATAAGYPNFRYVRPHDFLRGSCTCAVRFVLALSAARTSRMLPRVSFLLNITSRTPASWPPLCLRPMRDVAQSRVVGGSNVRLVCLSCCTVCVFRRNQAHVTESR